MTKDELITKQQLEIEELKIRVEDYQDMSNSIHNLIYCIGGPLNDNKLQYSKKQLSTFLAIAREIQE